MITLISLSNSENSHYILQFKCSFSKT